MKTYMECVPCFVRQAVDAGRHAGMDDSRLEYLVRRVLQEISVMRFTDVPPVMGAKIHALVRDLSGDGDPYGRIREHSNAAALAMLPSLRRGVEASPDPFALALRFAMAGNVVDFGAVSSVSDERVRGTLEKARTAALPVPEIEALRKAVHEADSILYIGDNAGEIVFDRLFIEQLPKGRVTYVVRGGPVINDVTSADAERTGMSDCAQLLDSGAAVPGIVLDECTESFRRAFYAADLVIAKGQGNYESLSGCDAGITFLLMAKCPVIARDIGCEVGSFIIINRYARTKHSETHATGNG